ncbi:MAG: methyltransferase domain-containing protein [Candidatus Abyssubacteria bacterium]
MASKHEPRPMPYTEAHHLLNPLRKLVLSPKKLVRRLDLKPDSAVLELGPGPGYFSLEVAQAVPHGRLVLVDIQQEMLDMARQRLESRGFTNVDYRKADATSLPFDTESFDVAFLVAVLGEVPDRDACLREIRRVLRPSGLLSLTEQNLGDPHFISRPEMLRSVHAAGFQRCAQFGLSFNYTMNFRKSP